MKIISWPAGLALRPLLAIAIAISAFGTGVFASASNGLASRMATTHATLTVGPTSGKAGNSITVSGSGYSAHETVVVSEFCALSGCGPGAQLLGSQMTDGNGSFSVTLVVPSWTPLGSHVIGGQGLSGGSFAGAPYNVTSKPTITLSPSSGKAGTTTTVKGINFGPHESVVLRWYCMLDLCGDGTLRLGKVMTNSHGAFKIAIRIPSTSPLFTHMIGARGATSGLSDATTYQVTSAPLVSFSLSSGQAGAQTTIHGTGFGKHELITLKWYCTLNGCRTGFLQLGTAKTNATGQFSASVVIPSVSPVGPHMLGATGETSRFYAVAIFTVKGK